MSRARKLTGDFVIPAPTSDAVVTESLIDSLVGDVVGYLVTLREPHCGPLPITDEQAWERARNIVAGLIGNYDIRPRAEGHA